MHAVGMHLLLSIKQLHSLQQAGCLQRPQEALVVLHNEDVGGVAQVQRVAGGCSVRQAACVRIAMDA